MAPWLVIGGVAAAAWLLDCAASSMEDDNEEAEKELASDRLRYAREVRAKKARLERNRKVKAAICELAAARKRLATAERVEALALRYAGCGRKDAALLERAKAGRPRLAAIGQAGTAIAIRSDGLAAKARRCHLQTEKFRRELSGIAARRFSFTCSRCGRRFTVRADGLEAFLASRVGGRVRCGVCASRTKSLR